MNRRGWTIRTKTTVAFALASMASTAAVLVLVTTASLWTLSSVSIVLEPSDLRSGEATATATATATARPESDGASPGDDAMAFRTTDGALSPRFARLASLQWGWAALGVVASGVLAGGVGWLVTRRVLRPVDRITETARCLSASTLHERIDLDGPDDELRRLSRTIDDLLGRLESAFESQRRFVAQASHELRTPLAVQRTALQVGLGDDCDPADVGAVRDELLEQNRRTEHLVESLLALAEADRGLDGRVDDLDLAELAGQVVSGQRDHARAAGVTLTIESSTSTSTSSSSSPSAGPDAGASAAVVSGAVVSAEPVLVRQLMTNLVDNAVEYNEPGGFVRVSAGPDGLCVENAGPVVSADDAAVLVEPFRRGVQGAATGRHSGLGLSIVAAIVRAHGWSLAVEPRPDGGLRVRVATV